jgi:hypothetical protein
MEEEKTYSGHEYVPVVRHPGGWALAFVHYSADPAKSPEWAVAARARGDADDWEKEMEINFSSVSGVRCFENFSLLANTSDTLEFNPELPLCLCCDFNVEPMAWAIAQIQKDEELWFLEEIWLREGSVNRACEEFLNRYGDFYGELWIYGDASGRGRSSNSDQRSNYDTMKIQFMRAPFDIRMKVPTKNPSNVNSVAAMNLRLKDKFGNPRIKIHPRNCPHLVRDMVEVVWEDGTKRSIKKERKKDRPYFWRTHMADAAMALVNREWPTRKELSRKTEAEKEHERKLALTKKRRKKRRLIGAFK